MALMKLLIIGALIAIVFNLGAGLIYLLKDPGDSRRAVRALSWRIGLSITLFIVVLLMVSIGGLGTNPHPAEVP